MTQKPRILIVDDEPGFVRLLKLVLENTGRYTVMEVDDSTRVVEVAKGFRPDLILLDFIMPKIDGGTVASRIRSEPELNGIPIVFLTATILHTDANVAPQIAGCPAIAKPIGVKELIEAIEENLVAPA